MRRYRSQDVLSCSHAVRNAIALVSSVFIGIQTKGVVQLQIGRFNGCVNPFLVDDCLIFVSKGECGGLTSVGIGHLKFLLVKRQGARASSAQLCRELDRESRCRRTGYHSTVCDGDNFQ